MPPITHIIAISLSLLGLIAICIFLVYQINPFKDRRDYERAAKTFKAFDWHKLFDEFDKQHTDLGPDRLDRAHSVYHHIMWIALRWNNLFSDEKDPIKQIAPFDKDVDLLWRFHVTQPDYDNWSTLWFSAPMRPREEAFETPHWITLEERQRTKLAYCRDKGLTPPEISDDVIIPVICV